MGVPGLLTPFLASNMAIIRGQEVGIHFVPLSLKSVHWFGRDVARMKTQNCFITRRKSRFAAFLLAPAPQNL